MPSSNHRTANPKKTVPRTKPPTKRAIYTPKKSKIHNPTAARIGIDHKTNQEIQIHGKKRDNVYKLLLCIPRTIKGERIYFGDSAEQIAALADRDAECQLLRLHRDRKLLVRCLQERAEERQPRYHEVRSDTERERGFGGGGGEERVDTIAARAASGDGGSKGGESIFFLFWEADCTLMDLRGPGLGERCEYGMVAVGSISYGYGVC